MNNPFKSENYKKNLDSLIKAVKLGNAEKQYNKTLRDLSHALEGFTGEAKGIAEFVIYTDLNNYVEQPLGLFKTLMNRILGKNFPTKNSSISNFVNDELSSFTLETAAKYTRILKKIDLLEQLEKDFRKNNILKDSLNLEQSEKSQGKDRSHEVSLEGRKQKEGTFELRKEEQPKEKLGGNRMRQIKRPTTAPPAAPDSRKVRFKSEISSDGESKAKSTSSLLKGANSFSMPDAKENPSEDSGYESSLDQGSEYEDISNYQEKKQKENPLYEQREDSGYGSSLNEESVYKEISNYQEKKSKILIENSQSSKSPKEEPIYATVPKEHIEAKRERKQKQQPQSLVPPKPPQAPKKMFTTGQEVRQESKVVIKDKPAVPPKPKNLSRANQKVSTEPKVVGVILKKSAERVPLKSENQDNRKSAQKAAGKAIPKVAAATMKGGANREMGSKVKALKEKFEQNQAKGNANVQLAESKTTPAAQADIGVKKKQSHSFLTENKRSATKHVTAKSDPKSHVSKNSLLTHANVKEMVAQIEKGKGGR
ncbi:hypothetical protein RYF71_03675 [Wolbachia endosymbiont of Drosophila malagassya]|uniref:hypothetical protein n=1 Tax=Wolbachia endosymbiont of Drosophila seguyi TaxID=3002581 RepID=UPI0023A9CDF2|nr:hypothetical protein [Wolbachia endosymbiont of Drosophila seguyi]MDE5065940.1 hypothetical protein [Wolbachia endosymbiont of Drosophila seguyi]MDU8922900.1 hypothetical protein [Wolbachia endosymbiont of Drosophila seguyi]MDU8941106.1 hypothetical protein [Wolbachia endosymbiont of Drosophila malagassya]